MIKKLYLDNDNGHEMQQYINQDNELYITINTGDPEDDIYVSLDYETARELLIDIKRNVEIMQANNPQPKQY